MKMMKFFCKNIALAIAMLSVMPLAIAVNVTGTTDSVQFNNLPNKTRFIQVSGPDGINLSVKNGKINQQGGLTDGQYRFQLYIESNQPAIQNQYKASLNNGRSASTSQGPVIQPGYTGYFRLIDGKVSQSQQAE